MKQTGVIKTFMSNRALLFTGMLLSTLVLPFTGYSQTPPPPTGGSGPGGSLPDSPLGGVPFDNHMTVVLLLAGVVFAVIVRLRIQKNSLVRKSVN